MKIRRSTFAPIALVTIAIVLLSETDMTVMGRSVIGQIPPYLINSVKDLVHGVITPPSNHFDSIQYFLFTPSNPKVACYIEPYPEEFNGCPFDPSYKTKFLIPGFNASVNPGNLFEQIKDKLMDVDKYNVIILNWTAYSYPPYSQSVFNMYLVGHKVADMVKFLRDYAGVNPDDIHLIGHSLGAQLCGVIGKHVPNLGRITGLDPAGPLFNLNPVRLRHTDAKFVDVIHSSNYLTGMGLGLYDAVGTVDFYPNGGEVQPNCEYGDTFIERDGKPTYIQSIVDLDLCNHDRALHFFLFSIEDCEYLATQCSSYERYKQGQCPSSSRPTDRMGLYAKKIEGLRPRTKFYLETGATAPFCKTK